MRLHFALANDICDLPDTPVQMLFPQLMHVADIVHGLYASTDKNNEYMTMFNLMVDPYTGYLTSLNAVTDDTRDASLVTYANGVSPLIIWPQIYEPSTPLTFPSGLNVGLCVNLIGNLSSIAITLYLTIITGNMIVHTLNINKKYHPYNVGNTTVTTFAGVFANLDKLESTDETLVLAVLGPGCFFIVFTHLMSLADHTTLFGFAEGGLPVIYGIIMLAEHLGAIGSYFVAYISGTRGKKITALAALEDIVASLILIGRVLLQAVRGIIVGMFHFISRELLGNMSKFGNTNNFINSNITTIQQDQTDQLYIIDLITSVILSGGSFVIITSIMFLQLIFLLVSVGLFCKCGFVSGRKC